ncbi:hypothetical protein YC2023_097900 [Brassica napus]
MLRCWFIQTGKLAMMALIRSGAFVDAVDIMERSPLYYACKVGKLGCIYKLLQSYADPGLLDSSGNTLIHATVFSLISHPHTQLRIVDLLLVRESSVAGCIYVHVSRGAGATSA